MPRLIHRFDALSVLTLWMVSLYIFPSEATISAVQSLGRPSTILGLACLLWWVLHTTLRSRPEARPHQPVRIAVVVFVLVVLVSYAVTNARGMPVTDRSVADSALIRLASWVGPALVVMDGVRRKDEFFVLLRRIGVAGTAMATLGLIQFVTGRTWIDIIQLPGFTTAGSDLGGRGGFFRPVGTASHALEYAIVISAAFPLTLNAALFLHRSGLLRRWYGSVIIALASLFAVSRSALIGVVTGLLVLAPTWPPRVRAKTALVGICLLGAVYLTVPGIIGTLRGMFSLSGDTSTDSRVDSWDTAFEIAGRYPGVGRGFGTFIGSYRILDNAYLVMLIEVGIVGVIAYFAMILTALYCVFTAAHRTNDPVLRNQLQALGAALTAVALLAAFFDAFSFNQAVATTFLLIGCCGAARQVQTDTG
ncbi:O-antigen polymerase [Xylanimonas cellulosilytica DSM 15894]|uniref:O-antigen polymerase n=1 Tax=Xylanimonas cellulosilytica (strain DSM 15894 / JCM 12276 / CECT 5975 / KCTC 9989 / LMG 20990 / NBRC 107835 / XIL07) TaxID=446471 RepID=D1BXS0_XYLCX|nr:O-antigen ligase family protein [Xylanimonas cellulosilytica]ACZ31711.1 O-antigen polymerase [Xylanimonas cellulosilytica DSM 15894]